MKQQTVGSYAGAWITCILNGGLCKNNNSGHGLDILLRACACVKRVCVFGYRAVLGRLLQTLCDELGSDVPTWQIVDKRVHQSHTSCIPPSLCRAFTHLGDGVLSHMSKNVVHTFDVTVSHRETTHMVRMQSLFYALILILHSITVNRGVITLYSPVRLAHWRYLLIPNHMVPLSWALLIGSLQHLWNFSIAKKTFLVFVIHFQFLLCLQAYWLVFWVHSREFNSGICSLCDC